MKKRIISLVLLLVMLVAVFVACDKGPEVDHELMAKVIANLETEYGALEAQTSANYNVLGVIALKNAEGTNVITKISWSSDKSEITFGEMNADTYMVEVKVPAGLTEALDYKLIATIVDEEGNAVKDADGNAYSISFNRTVPVGAGASPIKITGQPVPGTAYKLVVEKTIDGSRKTLFMLNESGAREYYHNSTEEHLEAPNVYVEAVTGGFHVSIGEGDEKKYLSFEVSGNYLNLYRRDVASTVWVWDEEKSCLKATNGDKTAFICSDGTYTTFSIASFSQIDNSSKAPAYLATMGVVQETAQTKIDDVSLPNKAYGGFLLPTIEGAAIAWSVPAGSAISIANGIASVSSVTSETSVTITATLTYEGQTATKDFTVKVQPLPAKATTLDASKSYYLVMPHQPLQSIYYVVSPAEIDNYGDLESTYGTSSALTIKVELVEGGFYMYYMDGEAKKYINIALEGTYKNVVIGDSAVSVWSYDSHGALVAMLGSDELFLGNYGTYDTFGVSSSSYLDGDKAAYNQHIAYLTEIA